MVIVLDFRTVTFQKVMSYVVMEVIQGANSNPGIEHLSIRIVHATLPRKYHRMYFWEATVVNDIIVDCRSIIFTAVLIRIQ